MPQESLLHLKIKKMRFKKAILALITIITFNVCYGQSNKFKLDTLVDNYLVKIVVYKNTLNSNNIKSFFSFYDSTSEGRLKFYYVFRFLPSVEDKAGSYVPIFTDYENVDNSNYFWKDIQYESFDFEKAKSFVFNQFRKHLKIELEDYSTIQKELKEKATNEYIRTFNALINKDYLTFVKSLHPATIKDSSYSTTAEYFKSINSNAKFKYTSVRIDKMDTLINYYGEIQFLFYSYCGYTYENEIGESKKIMIARSFDNGENWYFREILKQDIDYEIKQSNRNFEPRISPQLLVLIN